MSCLQPDRTRIALVLLAVAAFGCGSGDTELARTHRDMDSLRVYLGELRAMEYELGEVVSSDSVASEVIVPLIADRFRPTVAGLRGRAEGLRATEPVRTARNLLLSYLEVRLQAYDAAILGQAEGRPELFELFAAKQSQADSLGRALEDEVFRLRSAVPGYD